ncbi:MAG: metallophosphoesterase family protein [Caulobacteraceae bacterium]
MAPLRWTSPLRRSTPPAAASTGGRTIYAIGDVHGCSKLLEQLLASIVKDAATAGGPQRPVVVLMGDYVDRGEDSRGVIDQAVALAQSGRFEVHALKGNHEDTLLAFLTDPAVGPTWADFGGLETLASYGVAPPRPRAGAAAWAKASEDLGEALPPAHLAFFSRLELTVSFGDYLFVHAGVRPGVPLARQSEHDLLWIRDEFLRASAPSEKTVVHGHTPELEPFLGAHRIGIDTGAYATGVLTAVKLRDAERSVLQARAGRGRA